MKVTSVIAGAITIVGAYAAATPDAQAFCLQPGQPCDKVKRAADAAAFALAAPNAEADPKKGPTKGWVGRIWRFCQKPGQPCRMAKRHADAIADAVSDAYAAAGAEASELALGQLEKRGAEPVSDFEHAVRVKRAADAIADALAAPEADAEAGYGFKWRFCVKPGQPCRKAKRAAEALADVIDAANEELEF
ncbi:uncharacterized protein J3D65DRAFT_664713 [Phyllosticta citribraziliensis]|uniref:Uncharacterized protein n=1 Tax=Phyllosticta citribraziliensis TaxID=989973 RepID=A0ABR1M412_9PEZI